MKKKFVRTGKYFVYILECNDGSYYTGYTPMDKVLTRPRKS